MTGPTPRATTAGVAADHAVIARRRARALVATALRTRSVHAREVLAEVAWPGTTPAELEAWATSGAGDGSLPPGSDPTGLADYARVVAVQLGTDADRAVARGILERLARSSWAGLAREHVEMLAQLRVLGGDAAGAVEVAADPRVREGVSTSVRADALHPRLAPGSDPVAWTSAFSEALNGPEMAPFLPPAPGSLPSLDDLRVETRPDVPSPLRVTVIMSCFRPGPSLLTAVRSVLAQTWTNLELFVVDDASGPGPDGEWAALLDRVEELDERVTVVRKAVNGGTYRARNTVLRMATGDLAVVIDSDDWWHPQTLEVCAAPLLRKPFLLATRGEGVRVTPDLVLTRPGYRPRFQSAATVLFRLPQVVARIGFFDPTRKGADTEFARRLQASFGPVLQDVAQTTTILRADEGSLSAQEFANGWRHPARHQYKSLYTPWHEQISQGRSDPYLDPELPRRFPEPLRWSRATDPALEPRRHLHLCLAGDWRRDGGPQRSMMEEIHAAREAGLRVGVMHLEALRFMTTQDASVSEPFLSMVRRGEVTWVHADDDVDIDVLMIRYPPILQYPPHLSRGVRARNVLVMANQGPLELDGRDQRYVVADVTRRAEDLFGVPVTWVPQSPTIRRLLLEQDPTVPLADWDNPGLIDLDAWSVRPAGPPGWSDGNQPVVVGRHSRDTRIKFPTTYEELLRGYTFPKGYEVRMLGAVETVARLREEAGSGAPPVPDGWTLLPHQTDDVRPFLAGLDFVLYLDDPQAHEAFGRSLLESAASGALTIAHPKHESTFGDALDYAEPGEAQELIARYVADPELYAARVARTRAAVAERYGHASFVGHLRPLLSPAEAPGVAGRAASVGGRAAQADSGPMGVPEGPVSLTFLRPTAPTAPWVGVDGAETLHVVLRGAADAERSDGVCVLHRGVARERLEAWLQAHLATTPATDPAWTPGSLLASSPDGVVGILVRRDGLIWAAGRGSWSGSSRDEQLCALGGTPPRGWTDLAWWATSTPSAVVLVPGAEAELPTSDGTPSGPVAGVPTAPSSAYPERV